MITDLEAAKLLIQHLEKRVEDLEVSIANTTVLLDLLDQKLKEMDDKVEKNWHSHITHHGRC